MAKAGGKDTTEGIRYSQAKAFVGAYLGNVTDAERAIRKGLGAGEIPCQCVRFDIPEGYSGPRPGDPKFWREPDNLNPLLGLEWLDIKGDSARYLDDAVAYGVTLDRAALVRLGLLPPDDVDGDDNLAKIWAARVARDLKRAGKLDQVTYKTELANLILTAGVAAGRDKVGMPYVRDNLEEWDLWPISKI